jgi:hypothetical protein
LYVRNERRIHAPAERVWAWLVRAPLWPTYVPTAKKVRVEGGWPELGLGARFTWRQMGQALESEVRDFDPPRRLGWFARNRLLRAYHVWDLRADGEACLVTTDESQLGFIPAALGPLVRPRMLRAHDLWLEGLERRASAGAPP